MSDIDDAWRSHDRMREKVEELRDAITDYLDDGVPDLPAEWRLLALVREAERHLAVPFETASDQEAAHLEAAQRGAR